MGSSIRYLVPYQIDVLGKDLTTNKRIGNTFYVRNQLQSVSPPAYGAPIAGSGDTATLLTQFANAWEVMITAVLSTKFQMVSYTMRAMMGWGYGTPVIGINALITGGLNTVIQTGTPHGLVTGNAARITGVTAPSGANGIWNVSVVSPTQLTIPVATTGAWSNNGSIQSASGRQNWQYADQEVKQSTATGGVTGDALPIFSDVSVRRINSGVGKNFRSRVSMAPVGESMNDFGKLTTAALAIWVAELVTFTTFYDNGGSENPGSGQSYNIAVSKQLASTVGSPFTESMSWGKGVTAMLPRTYLGSMLKRKPKLTTG